MPYTAAQLAEARSFDAKLAQERRLNPMTFKGGRLRRQLSLPAFFNTYRDCPVGTPSEERNKYIADNERIYLEANEQRTPRGMVNRHGRVRERTVYGPHGEKAVLAVA